MQKPFIGDWPLTQGFGQNPNNYVQFGLKGHNGLDYGLPTGTNILAPHNGTIIEATNDPSGYGNYLKIENDKEGSVLAHLQDFLVGVGDIVTQGQLIAHSDNTGNSTGPHLHWGYYLFPRDRQNGYAGFIDQLPLLNAPTVITEPMATITQKELDDVRKARDNNYNAWQKDEELIKNLNDVINSKNRAITDLQGQISSMTTQMTDLASRANSLLEQARKVPDLEKQMIQAESDRKGYLAENQSLRQSVAQLQRRLDEKMPKTFASRLLFLLRGVKL